METDTKWLGKHWYFQEETDSTNDWAKRAGKEGAPHGSAFVAESQTKGKGRRGKSWENPRGTGLAMSILLRPQMRPENAPMMTLLMGLSGAQAVEDITGLTPGIKWPNDLVLSGKKICGILTEMTMSGSEIDYVVIGIGVNLNMEAFPEDIREKATSLKLEGGKTVERDEMAAAVLRRFEENYNVFLETCSLSALRDVYMKYLVNLGREVKVMEGDRELRGICTGINDSGELLIEKSDGTCEAVFAGEVSVRGLYGYV